MKISALKLKDRPQVKLPAKGVENLTVYELL